MLTGKLVRVRYARNRLLPAYLDVTDRVWREVAQLLLEVFRDMKGKTRGEMEEEIQGDDRRQPNAARPPGSGQAARRSLRV